MSSRRRQSPMVSYPTNQRKKSPNNNHPLNRLPSFLKPGAAVEISTNEEGFRGAWFMGKVVAVPSPDKDPLNCQVEYATISEADGSKPLKEFVDLDHLRPALLPPMSEMEKKRDILAGEDVDAFYKDVWWEGTVTEVRGDGKFSVYFRGSQELIQFRRDELRFHREWINDTWKPPLDEAEEEEEEEEEDELDDYTEDREVQYLVPQVNLETTKAIAKEMFSSGTVVEVSSDEEGFVGCWFAAKVVERVGDDEYRIEYKDLREENGVEPLKEVADFLHIRPPPPPSDEDIDFAVGDKIDAFYNDGWWVGEVIDNLKDGSVGIFFRESAEKMRFGRQGLRLHKDWVNGTWELPLKRGELKRAKKVPCERNVRPKRAIDKQYFSIGAPVEVSSIEEGFEDSWFLAKLIEYRGTDKCLVEYDKLKAEDGKEPLREEVNEFQIRPQPLEMVMVNPFEKLDKVNALYNDGWWIGVVKKVLAKSSYLVHFPRTDEILKFHHSQLRLHQEWSDGKWITSSKSQRCN